MESSTGRITERRVAWTEAATDYVHEHGLIGLSLRPLAATLGTSDRMLIYHFGSKDELVAAVLRASNDRAAAHIAALGPSPDLRTAVEDLWAAVTSPTLERCQRLYVEAAALGLFGKEPYASVVREANARWVAALADHLVASGVRPSLTRRVVPVIDAAFMGFQLDLPLDGQREGDAHARARAIADLADAVSGLA